MAMMMLIPMIIMTKQTKHFPFSKTNICKCSQQTFYLAERMRGETEARHLWVIFGVATREAWGWWLCGERCGGSFEQTNTQLQLQLCLSLRCCAHCKQKFLFSVAKPPTTLVTRGALSVSFLVSPL